MLKGISAGIPDYSRDNDALVWVAQATSLQFTAARREPHHEKQTLFITGSRRSDFYRLAACAPRN